MSVTCSIRKIGPLLGVWLKTNRISDGAHVVGLGLARLHRMLLDLELAQSRILLREWAPKKCKHKILQAIAQGIIAITTNASIKINTLHHDADSFAAHGS